MPRIAQRSLPQRAILSLFLAAAAISLSCHGAVDPKDPQSVSIGLERTRCYGFCPEYTVTIHGDGSVKYFGKYFVAIPGEQTAKIQPDKLQGLLRAFENIRFFSLQDRYIDLCTDMPTIYISLAVDGKSKRIENYSCHRDRPGPQADLLMLADQIDALSGAKQWINCDAQCLKKLIASGLNVNSRGPDGTTPLLVASHGANLDKVQLLLSRGAQPNLADERGYTPLMYASMANQSAIAQELLTHGAEVNATDNKGFTALDMVAGGSEIERVLLKAGARHKGKIPPASHSMNMQSP
jgi:hypothetical protein